VENTFPSIMDVLVKEKIVEKEIQEVKSQESR
jgi:hypothetical protein